MSEAPLDLKTFNHRDASQFSTLYVWAGSCDKMARALNDAGTGATPNTLNYWRKRHGIPTANESYRLRDAPKSEPPDNDGTEAAQALFEYLQQRKVPTAPPPTAARLPGDYATCLVCSDLHFPHHHQGAFEVFLGLADIIKPDEIVVDGDAFDFSQIGKYVRDPAYYVPLQTDIDMCREQVLAPIAAASPRSVRRFIVGNHEENRWRNYLFTRSPELSSLRCLTMEAVLGLAEMGWVWQPYEYWVTDTLCIYHGDRHTNTLGGGSAMSARKESIDMGCSTVTGHTHHAGAFFRQDRTGYRVSYEIGGLMDWRKMQAAGVTAHQTPTKAFDWHLACALIRYRPGHSAFRVELIPIIDEGERTFCIWRDEEIVA